MTDKKVRVDVAGIAVWGNLDGDMITLDDGSTIPEREASFLAPVEPSKIIAVHLTYRAGSPSTRRGRPPTRPTS